MTTYVLANPHAKCRVHYRKETLKIKRHDKTLRVVGCVWAAPKTTASVATTTTTQPRVQGTTTTTQPRVQGTTTTTQPRVQGTTTTYDGFSSGVTASGSFYYVTESATVTIGPLNSLISSAPNGGTVTFTDVSGTTICMASVSSNAFDGGYITGGDNATCQAGPLLRAPANPITAKYSGTAFYLGSSGFGNEYVPTTTTTTIPHPVVTATTTTLPLSNTTTTTIPHLA